MSALLHIDIHITDDLTPTQEQEIIKQLSKAAQTLGAAALLKGRHSIATQIMQALLNGATHLEIAGNNWNGTSQIAVPQMVMSPGQRPI